jgi:2'-5' RNA ligase
LTVDITRNFRYRPPKRELTMPFAVEMFFEEDADDLVRGVWADLAQANVTSFMIDGDYRPHVTLGVFDQYSSPEFENELPTFAKGLPRLPLQFDYIGVFLQPKCVVFFGPVVTEQLLSVHRDFNSHFANLVTGASPLCPTGKWVPHCTLAFDIPRGAVPAAVEVCSRVKLRFTTEVTEIGLVEFPGHREVLTCELKAV